MGAANQDPPSPTPYSEPWNPPAAEADERPGIDLRFWLVAVAGVGIGAMLLRQVELATFTMLAGLFAVTHAADLDPARHYLDQALSWLVPVLGAITFLILGTVALAGESSATIRTFGIGFAVLGAAVSLASAFPAVAGAIARRMFRVEVASRTFQLAARLALIGVLIYPIASLGFPQLLDALEAQEGTLVGQGSLWGNLIGLTLLALGGVGLGVRRDLAATLERLGIRPFTPRDWIVVALGVVMLIALNAGAEAAQHRWFPELWARDQQVNRLITTGLSRSDALLLGFSAGVGEEIALRGALQPRLGIFMTALVFALLHAQYTWFGVGTILVIGLTLGVIRRRTSTSVAILVHTLYDIFAVFTFRP